MKYIDLVRPLEMMVLYEVYGAKKIAPTDLAVKIGAPRKDLENAVNRLAALGYIAVEREGNRKTLMYVRGLFKGLKRVAPSEEGFRIAKKVVVRYFIKGYIALPGKQDQSLKGKPDLVAIPIDKSTWRPLYGKAVAVEVESCNELETHPEHVVHNWLKESTRDFAEIHTWTSEECFERLEQLYDEHPEVHGKVKVFSVKLEKTERDGKTSTAIPTAITSGERPVAEPVKADSRCAELKLSNGSVVCLDEAFARVVRAFLDSGYWVEVRGDLLVALEPGEEPGSGSAVFSLRLPSPPRRD